MNSILLVEDDLSLIDGLEFSLRKHGFHIDIARTVNEALAIVQSKKHDLLILDLTLPDGRGFEICKRVRESWAVPIIFLNRRRKYRQMENAGRGEYQRHNMCPRGT